jgi:dUTP pyrophosphatase
MIQFTKIRDVKSPQRGTSQSAGIDFFVPERTPEFIRVLQEKNPRCAQHGDKFVIRPNDHILIPSGIKVRIPEGTALIAFNKSGVASKLGLDVGASVIDQDYRGEVHISLTNTTQEPVSFECGQKIIQFILLPVYFDNVEEVESEEVLYSGTVSERGEGGFGSTGQK